VVFQFTGQRIGVAGTVALEVKPLLLSRDLDPYCNLVGSAISALRLRILFTIAAHIRRSE
jgi:hypothetical protein